MWGGWLLPRQGGRGPEGTPMPYLQWLSESVSEGDGTFIRMLAPLDEQQAAESVATAGARTPPVPYTPGYSQDYHKGQNCCLS
ncbi:hypothetical protein DIPPA_19577 [Diplonema papillatum]|nr:hypothetical protein DIPPA_19577 [Diplonema papillatum]